MVPAYWLSGEGIASDFRVCAMFTVGTPYEAEAGRLISSLIDHRMAFHVDALPKAESWDHAVAQKPFAIKRAMAMYPGERILFVDVDAWFHRPVFHDSEMQGCDFGAHWFQGPSGGYENRNDDRMLSGTMFWNRTPKAEELLERWITENQNVFEGGGQANLERCLGKVAGLNVHRLTGRWCRVFDKPQFYAANEPTWIEHTIASRENRGSSKGCLDKARQRRIGELKPRWQPRTVVMPNRGEFGLKICYHVPAVHALGTPDLVIHEPGEKVLYPRAQKTIEISPANDDDRRGMKERNEVVAESVGNVFSGAYRSSRQMVTDDKSPRAQVKPLVSADTHYDVVLCPRLRQYGNGKNWIWWPEIAEEFEELGLRVFAAGDRATSWEMPCSAAWEEPDALIASLAAMQNCKIVLCTDSGLAHLAAMCGAKILMIVDGEDKVAPGYWPVKRERFEGADLTMIENGWPSPDSVVNAVVCHAK